MEAVYWLLTILALVTDGTKIDVPPSRCTEQTNCRCFIINNTDLFPDCSNLNLSIVPNFSIRVTMIDMSNNTIKTLKTNGGTPSNLTFFNLSRNAISSIYPNMFINLTTMETLDLSHNKLIYKEATFYPDVFKGLENLKILSLKYNHDKGTSAIYPDDALSRLLSLQTLEIDGIEYDVFGSPMRKLTQLSSLDMSSKRCHIRHLISDAFLNTPHLETLDISFCDIQFIDNGTFRYLSKLRSLDISNNEKLTFSVLGNLTYDLQFTSIITVKANKVHTDLGIGTEIRKADIVHIQNTKLEELYLESNKIEIFEFGVLSLLPDSLWYISLEDNRLLMGTYYLEFSQMRGLRILNIPRLSHSRNLSQIHPRMKRSGESYQDFVKRDINDTSYTQHREQSSETLTGPLPRTTDDITRELVIYLPPNLEVLFFNNSNMANDLPRLAISRNNKFKYADCSGSFIYSWKGPLIGFSQLEYIDLSNNYCTHVSTVFFKDMVKLKTLRVSNNFLGFVLNTDKRGLIFSHLKRLRYLELVQNKIQSLPRNIFRGLKRIESLNLSNNMIRDFEINFRHMKYIKHIDVSRNELSVIRAEARSVLNTLWLNKNVTLYLQGNRIQCSCDTLEFLRWIYHNRIHFSDFNRYTCNFDNGTSVSFGDFESILMQMELICLSKVGIIAGISVGIALFILVIVTCLGYRFRWKLRYLFYLSHYRYRRYTPLDDEEQDFRYDAFVSYADEEREFVINNMINKLEKDLGFRLCIHHRDFIPGTSIHDNMANAIKNSRRTIVILSRSFLRSDFCMWEFNMAKMESLFCKREKGELIFMIYYETMPTKDLPLTVLEHIQSQSYIEYPKNDINDGPVEDLFWGKFAEALR